MLAAAACCFSFVTCAAEKGGDRPAAGSKTASIEGVVREQGTGATIAGASVFLVRASNQAQMRSTTDADGRFVLDGLEPGRHLVAVVREGYVLPGRQNISGYPYQLEKGQTLSNVELRLIPTGTIAGRVFGPDGKPANLVEVQLLQNVYLLGHPQWTLVDRGGSSRNVPVVTNDRGEFRAVGVDPGQYALRFVSRELSVASVTREGASLAPMLYPEGLVDVKSGRETLLDDVKLKSDRRGWIRVIVVNESGEPLEGMGNWEVRPPNWIGAEYALAEKRVVNEYHEFQPDSPGMYDVVASWSSRNGLLAGMSRVNYRGADIEVKLRIQKPQGRLSGQIVVQDASGATTPWGGAEVAIGPRISYFARSNADGALTFPDIYPGSYQLGFVRGIPADSFLLSVMHGKRDVLREDIVVRLEETKLDVVVSLDAGVLGGKVLDTSGKPLHNALVALVPESPLRERKDYYGAYKDTRTDQNGGFEVLGITPGSYQAYAWVDAPASAFRNAGFMKAFAGKGMAVTLARGERARVELQAIE